MPTPSVPAIGHVAGKWRRRVEGARDDYRDGVTAKANKWEPAATAASAAFKTAVSSSDIEQRFRSGVTRAGTAKYTKRATTLGPDRYAQAAPAAEGDFSQRMGPYLQAIGTVDLPARGPRGAPTNYNRQRPIGEALHKLRVGGR